LLKNKDFERVFINTSADLLNSWFKENRAAAMVDEMAAVLAPNMREHLDRWQTAGSTNEWFNQVRGLRQFATQRPVILRQHFVRQFKLGGYQTLTVEISDPAAGRVRVNRLIIDPSLPGVVGAPYPWRGWYFKGVPVELEALPAPGWMLVRWEKMGISGAAQSEASKFQWDPQENATFKAVFGPKPPSIRNWVRSGSGRLRLELAGVPERTVRVEASVDLRHWEPLGETRFDVMGEAHWEVSIDAATSRFMRLVMP